MMKMAAILLTLIASGGAHACAGSDVLDFGGFYAQPSPNVSHDGTKVTIDTAFLDELRSNPSGELLERNRPELFYLIARGNRQATNVGMLVLAYLIENPTVSIECDTPHELFGKEELAFVLSRSDHASDALCNLPPSTRQRVVALYRGQSALWSNVDPPWMPGGLQCAG